MARQHHLTDALGLTDRERLLTVVAMFGTGPFAREWRTEKDMAGWYIGDPEPGDLVKSVTQRVPNRWNVAWYVGDHPDDPGRYGLKILRELGGEGLCNMGNEMFYSLRGVPKWMLLEGHQFRAYVKTVKAFGVVAREVGRYSGAAMFQDLSFPDRHSKDGVIGARCHLFSVPAGKTVRALPIPFRFESRARIGDIAETIIKATPEGVWEDRFEPMGDGNRWAVNP